MLQLALFPFNISFSVNPSKYIVSRGFFCILTLVHSVPLSYNPLYVFQGELDVARGDAETARQDAAQAREQAEASHLKSSEHRQAMSAVLEQAAQMTISLQTARQQCEAKRIEAEEAAAKLLIATSTKRDLQDASAGPEDGIGDEALVLAAARDKAESAASSRQAEVDLLTRALTGAHSQLTVLRYVNHVHLAILIV